jgi:hypothetical protein
MEMDLSVFLAAVIENAGGEVRVPYDTFVALQQGEPKALSLDLEDDGATLVFRVGDVPEDLEEAEND